MAPYNLNPQYDKNLVSKSGEKQKLVKQQNICKYWFNDDTNSNKINEPFFLCVKLSYTMQPP